MKYISVCSGIEAASVAWHGLGWTPLAFSEVDAFPAAVLAARWPGVPNLGDMTKFAEWPEELLADCDLLVGGTPCQAFSVAGLRRSLDDARGNLSLVYVKLWNRINEARRSRGRTPAVALWENVPGVLSTKDNAFGCFVGGLLGCDDAPETQDGKWPKAGFLCSETVRVGWRVLDAQYFAVAQRRRRVFLVAVPSELVSGSGGRGCPSEILSLRESLLGNPPTRGAKGQRVTGAVTARTGRNGGSSNDDVDSGRIVAFHPTQDPISSTDGSIHAMGCGSKNGACTQAVAFNPSHFTGGKDVAPSEVVAPLSADADKGDQDTVVSQAFTYSGYSNQPAWMTGGRTDCLPASGHNDGSHQGIGVLGDMEVRRLTPRECERLQGFPDDYTNITYRKKPASDGPRYKALGNSMAVPCMHWLGVRIGRALHTLPDKETK